MEFVEAPQYSRLRLIHQSKHKIAAGILFLLSRKRQIYFELALERFIIVIMVLLKVAVSFGFILYNYDFHIISQNCKVDLRQKMRLIVVADEVLVLEVLMLIFLILVLRIEVSAVEIEQTMRQLVARYSLDAYAIKRTR